MTVGARPYDFITFDCYGTLIDWVGGITAALATEAHRIGAKVAGEQLFAAYLRAEVEIEAGAYRPYREILAETARRVAKELGWGESGSGSFLPASLPAWRPFADTNSALERLRAAGYRLGILSNVDDDLLAATRRHFTIEFDLLVTAEQVKSYKPGHRHFLEARRRIDRGAGANRWLHAAQSYYHDIVPASALKIDAVWVNRQGERLAADAAQPMREVADLVTLADWLAA
jgi:2-haloalkanoic acid dehalogenase type II